METTDNTLLEMQQQLKQMKSKLDNQKILNDSMLRHSYKRGLNRMRIKSNVPIIAGAAVILLIPMVASQLGLSIYFVIFTLVMMLVCVIATILTNQHLPRMDKDLVTATKELTKFKKIHADWIKYSFPLLGVWLIWLVIESFKSNEMSSEMRIGFICGIAFGLVIGLALGLKNRRDILEGADELMGQIDNIVNNG